MVEVVESGSSTSAPSVPIRQVGPGRLERSYLARIEALEESRAAAALELERSRGELAVAGRLERGLQRLLDRQEERVELSVQREKRLALALGAVQRENELLRRQLELGAGQTTAGQSLRLPQHHEGRTGRRRGFWSRLFAGR